MMGGCSFRLSQPRGSRLEWRGKQKPWREPSMRCTKTACSGRLIWADLHHRGQLIDDNVIVIAATPLQHALTLVTGNAAHFSRIPGPRNHLPKGCVPPAGQGIRCPVPCVCVAVQQRATVQGHRELAKMIEPLMTVKEPEFLQRDRVSPVTSFSCEDHHPG